MGRGLHQVAVHFVGQGILKPEGRLINASYHIHPHCRLHGHGAAGSVVHGRQPLAGQLLNGVPYGGIGVESAGAHLEPRPVQHRPKPLPAVQRRGAGQVGKEALGLPKPCAEHLLELLGRVEGRRMQARRR